MNKDTTATWISVRTHGVKQDNPDYEIE